MSLPSPFPPEPRTFMTEDGIPHASVTMIDQSSRPKVRSMPTLETIRSRTMAPEMTPSTMVTLEKTGVRSRIGTPQRVFVALIVAKTSVRQMILLQGSGPSEGLILCPRTYSKSPGQYKSQPGRWSWLLVSTPWNKYKPHRSDCSWNPRWLSRGIFAKPHQ